MSACCAPRLPRRRAARAALHAPDALALRPRAWPCHVPPARAATAGRPGPVLAWDGLRCAGDATYSIDASSVRRSFRARCGASALLAGAVAGALAGAAAGARAVVAAGRGFGGRRQPRQPCRAGRGHIDGRGGRVGCMGRPGHWRTLRRTGAHRLAHRIVVGGARPRVLSRCCRVDREHQRPRPWPWPPCCCSRPVRPHECCGLA